MSLQKYLTRAQFTTPLTVDQNPLKPIDHTGTITSSLTNGEIFFKKSKKSYRLLWDEKKTPNKKSLVYGDYNFIGYRIVDGEWMISTTSPGKQKISIKNKNTYINIDPTINLQLNARRRGENLHLLLTIQGDNHKGLSVYRNGKRIVIFYIVEDKFANRLITGKFQYG